MIAKLRREHAEVLGDQPATPVEKERCHGKPAMAGKTDKTDPADGREEAIEPPAKKMQKTESAEPTEGLGNGTGTAATVDEKMTTENADGI